MILDENPQEQTRQYGEEVQTDEGLAKLAQAQTDEEAMAIEASLLIETDQIIDQSDSLEVEESQL